MIRLYCKHKHKNNRCRQYKIINKDSRSGCFAIYRTNQALCHKKAMTRPLRGFDRLLAKQSMQNLTAEQHREKCLNKADKVLLKSKNFQDIKSTSVFHNVRSELMAENDNGIDDINDINLEMMNVKKEDKWIQDLSLNPFFVTTYSNKQVKLLKIIRKRFPDKEITFYCDATGGLVRKPKNVKKRVFNYSLILPVHCTKDITEPTEPLPIAEMISSQHDIKTIRKWLGDMLDCSTRKK